MRVKNFFLTISMIKNNPIVFGFHWRSKLSFYFPKEKFLSNGNLFKKFDFLQRH